MTYPLYTNVAANQLDSIKQQGELKVLTLNAASTYYMDSNGANGFEYQLAKMFAESIGVELKMITVDKYADIYPELIFNTGDIAAAGLSKQDGVNHTSIMFSSPYHEVKQQVLYRKGQHKRPRQIDDLQNGLLEVIDGTSHSHLLRRLESEYPDLSWRTNNDVATEELIELVEEGLVDYILADSHEISLQRRFYPELRIGFELGEQKQLRWAMKFSEDKSLLNAINAFFAGIKDDGRLAQMVHRYYSHVAKFNYSDLQTFDIHMKDRLPQYEAMFRREAEAYGLDWRLLAA
ncbi:MAG: transporter substrate-binding domain-containing protein, partial [Gammaproteobacteria bacterium]|nr:transporter substrate-binding domain-containing protein [Gammaproteobacteria bacterium]